MTTTTTRTVGVRTRSSGAEPSPASPLSPAPAGTAAAAEAEAAGADDRFPRLTKVKRRLSKASNTIKNEIVSTLEERGGRGGRRRARGAKEGKKKRARMAKENELGEDERERESAREGLGWEVREIPRFQTASPRCLPYSSRVCVLSGLPYSAFSRSVASLTGLLFWGLPTDQWSRRCSGTTCAWSWAALRPPRSL